ncbi:hypothetical protein [Clostridium sp. KNHs205]|uniref:hypothetical protein n=1 Tax=Clostridium sp. KNHs205 TaxID=1449050 RepID=UPI0006907397|nr:hypothetical protein [Clostridium sp. KNHs205]
MPALTKNDTTIQETQTQSGRPSVTQAETGFITERILDGADGEIHYSYYLPKDYDESRIYPMIVIMPGYGMMWFGEESSGSNLNWSGFRVWTEFDEDMIVVSAQLTDWGEKSARQVNELTE